MVIKMILNRTLNDFGIKRFDFLARLGLESELAAKAAADVDDIASDKTPLLVCFGEDLSWGSDRLLVWILASDDDYVWIFAFIDRIRG